MPSHEAFPSDYEQPLHLRVGQLYTAQPVKPPFGNDLTLENGTVLWRLMHEPNRKENTLAAHRELDALLDRSTQTDIAKEEIPQGFSGSNELDELHLTATQNGDTTLWLVGRERLPLQKTVFRKKPPYNDNYFAVPIISFGILNNNSDARTTCLVQGADGEIGLFPGAEHVTPVFPRIYRSYGSIAIIGADSF